MKNAPLPFVWLIVLIAGLPQIAETIYMPSLPDVAKTLNTSDAMAEYTLAIYLAGFALGILFWGNLSDRIGRKPCVLIGLIIYILGCIGCWLSTSITSLMLFRLVQSLGGSTGSVMGQSMARDAFQGAARGKVFSTVAGAIAFSPAIGPVVGGYLGQNFGWASNFLLLLGMGLIVLALSIWYLPETLPFHKKNKNSVWHAAFVLLRDRRVLSLGFLVSASVGIAFVYYGEGAFYLIELLGLTPTWYGNTFIGIALAGGGGALISRKLHSSMDSLSIMKRGVKICIGGSIFFVSLILTLKALQSPSYMLILVTLVSMMILVGGTGLIISNSLSLALEDYQHMTGTASSVFGCFYYAITSLFTFGMGFLHNDTLFPLPLYLLGITILMWVVYVGLEKTERQRQKILA